MTMVTVGYGNVAEEETIDSLDFIVSSPTSGPASTPTAISSLNTTASTDSVTEATTYRRTLSTTVTFAHVTVITFKYNELASETLTPQEFIATKLHAYNPTTEELTFFVSSDGLGVYGDWPVPYVSSYSQTLSTSSTYTSSTLFDKVATGGSITTVTTTITQRHITTILFENPVVVSHVPSEVPTVTVTSISTITACAMPKSSTTDDLVIGTSLVVQLIVSSLFFI